MSVRVLQRNRTNRIHNPPPHHTHPYTYTYTGKEIYFKELPHVTVGVGMSKISKAVGYLEIQVIFDASVLSPNSNDPLSAWKRGRNKDLR